MPSVESDFFYAERARRVPELLAWERKLKREAKEERQRIIDYYSMKFWTDKNGIEYESRTCPDSGKVHVQRVIEPTRFSDMDDQPGYRH